MLDATVETVDAGLIGSEEALLTFGKADRLNEVDVQLQAITERQGQYLAHTDLAQAIAGVPGNAAAALSHPLFDPEMMPSRLKATLPPSFSFLIDPAVRRQYNDEFVTAELTRYRSFFDDLDGRSLSGQQREDQCSLV